MSFDQTLPSTFGDALESQSLWNRAMSFDSKTFKLNKNKSQSLWNRAMSFDSNSSQFDITQYVSIPLEQGNVFRQQKYSEALEGTMVSIPLEQGNVFRHSNKFILALLGMSQSLWNRAMSFDLLIITLICLRIIVSIPLEQGNVFRPQRPHHSDQQR